MFLSMVLALAAAAATPAQGGLDKAPLDRAPVVPLLSPSDLDKARKQALENFDAQRQGEACTARNVQRAAERPGVLYRPGQTPSSSVTPLSKLPDAHLIHAVLREVGGKCQIEVVRYNVSKDPAKSAAPAKSKAGR